jgi:tetratricopeptide (TPR) repeat protein
MALGNLGSQYLDVGEEPRAIEHYQMALAVDRELKDKQKEAFYLVNLGNAYVKLGRREEALTSLMEAHRLARGIGYRLIEMASSAYLGDAHEDAGDWDKAAEQFRLAIDLADTTGAVQFQSYARMGMVRVHFYSSELKPAREAADAARAFRFDLSSDGACLIQGIAALRQGDRPAALEALSSALKEADSLLSRNPKKYDSLDVKGLALCGLALCEDIKHLPAAKEAFEEARAISSAPGVVQHILRLFDALAVADTVGVLRGIRRAAAGETLQTGAA